MTSLRDKLIRTDDSVTPIPPRQMALARWDNDGGAGPDGPQDGPVEGRNFSSDPATGGVEGNRPHRSAMKILMVLTSHDALGATGEKTGFWSEEFAAPYYIFKDNGAEIILASPLGGQPPLDPKSEEPNARTNDTRRFKQDREAQAALANTVKLQDINIEDVDAVFYPGGHGPLWDLTENAYSIALVKDTLALGKPFVAVCHAPGVLRHVKKPDGTYWTQGRKVTGFSNSEEMAVGLSGVVPFSVEDMLKKQGGIYSKVTDWKPHVVVDDLLITGQNPASSAPAAAALLAKLRTITHAY